ncbi:MAG: DegT/DnrJ/EryC1/StrS aminotransferase family protein [Elusimicrobia bacterium]|nr:DegT/DnrJ/EryC1/StrS aminotransferase family protein [Elusimicrobiota bacterium]
MSPAPISSIYSPPLALRPWRLEDMLPESELRFYSFGRRALAEALRLTVRAGSKVLLPEFICRDVLSSLAAVGAEPEFYAVGPDLAPALGPEAWPQASAVIAVDYFGFPQDLTPFRSYSARTGAAIIEDNAHGLFSRDNDGRLLGTRADIGLFSLRKTLALPNGALLAFRKGEQRWRVPDQQPFGESKSLRAGMKDALRSMLGASALFETLSVLRALRRIIRGSRFPPSERDCETRLPEPDAPCDELSHPLAVADEAQEKARRRALYRHFEECLKPLGLTPVFPALPENVVPYAFPFRMKPGEEAPCLRRLARESVEPLPWTDLPARIAPRASAHYLGLRLAHFLW